MDINSITPDRIASAYDGLAGRCMCGCKGKYFYTQAGLDALSTSDYRKDLYVPAPKKAIRVLRLIQAAALEVDARENVTNEIEVDTLGEWVSVVKGGRLYLVNLLPE